MRGKYGPRTYALCDLADLIRGRWREMPVETAMFLPDFESEDGAKRLSAVQSFLAQSGRWRGNLARDIKAELRERIEHGYV